MGVARTGSARPATVRGEVIVAGMTTVGVTGHRLLPAQARDYSSAVIRRVLTTQPEPLVGMSCLAAGTDQMFAEILLDLGGALHAVLPAPDYPETMPGADSRLRFDRLLAAAGAVTTLDHEHAGDQAYDEAGRFLAEHSDLLIAVWDGQPARGLGGTADAVRHARARGRLVVIAWPEGVQRG